MGSACLHAPGPLPPESAQPSDGFQAPLRGSITVLSPFGRRGRRFHTGLDLRLHRGANDPVYAARAGRVDFVGRLSGYGLIVSLRHEDGFYSRYAHLKNTGLKKGQRLEAGGLIGRVGRTGRATTEHLHFEILTPKSRFVDPAPYIFGSRS